MKRRNTHTAAVLSCSVVLLGPLACDSASTPAGTFDGSTAVDTAGVIEQRVGSIPGIGMVVAVTDAFHTNLISYGVAYVDGPPLSGNSVFEIGSVTKVLTGLLLADMAERGELSITDPVQNLLPPGVTVPTRGGVFITLEHLTTHGSGLPRNPDNWAPADPSNPWADYTADDLEQFLNSYPLPRDIGSAFEYSNTGVGLLGYALAQFLGIEYEQLVVQRICNTLGMDSTRIVLSDELAARLAVGHSGEVETRNWEFDVMAGTGAFRSSANDLVTFLQANLDLIDSSLLASMRVTHVPRIEMDAPYLHRGFAWIVDTTLGTELIYHSGGTGGYRSFVGLNPGSRRGVVVLTNSTLEVADIGRHLLDERYPLEP